MKKLTLSLLIAVSAVAVSACEAFGQILTAL